MSELIKEFSESRLKFTFDAIEWEIIMLDKHPDYLKIEKLNGTKGVDFLGIKDDTIYFIEVKNFKDYRIKNKDRLDNLGELLMTEVAQKVKDTLACIVAGKRNSTHDKQLWTKFSEMIADESKECKIILWLETDNISESNSIRKENRDKTRIVSLNSLLETLRSKLRWLVTKRSSVQILNTDNYRAELSFTVRRLPKNNV